MTSSNLERAAALAALLVGTSGEEGSAAPQLERSGREVEAGGSIARLLIRPASTLGYRLRDGSYQRVGAVPGDVVLLSRANADRLDALGVTVDPDTDLDAVEDDLGAGLPTDEQLGAMRAEDLVAYVAQHPDERERVRALEEARPAKGQRKSVLGATEPTPVIDDEAARAAAAADQGAGDEAQVDPEAAAIAEAQQGNDGGSGE